MPRWLTEGEGASGAPAIEVRQLSKRYRTRDASVLAVRDLSFEVGAGKSLALLGRNGAGKSTTVRMLATLLKPDEGVVLIGGNDVVREATAARAMLGVALQETGLPRRQTARRLLRHHARLYGMSEIEAAHRVAETIETFGLGAVSDRQIASYSGGERRRLHIALALLHRPAVVLLDEPTASLDPLSRQMIWHELRMRLATGATVLFTTHDLREADRHADRVAIIDEGSLIADSSPRELTRAFGPLALTLSFEDQDEARRALELLGRGELVDHAGALIAMSEAGEMESVIRLLEAEGIDTRSATLSEPSLDSVFRKLTTSGDRGAA